MGVDRPPGGGTKLIRQVVLEPVIDVEEEVEAVARDTRKLIGPEMGHVDQPFQGAATVDARCLGAIAIVIDHRNPPDFHGSLLPLVRSERICRPT